MGYNLTDIQKKSVYKSLANKSQFKVGLDFNFDRYFKSNIGIVNAINRIYKEVANDPEKFAVSTELMEVVEKGMVERKGRKHAALEVPQIEKVNERDLIIGVRNKAWLLLDKRLDYLTKNKKALKAESIMALAKIAGISFDKAQIVKGEATEHIAMRAKISSDITATDAMEELMKFRDVNNSEEE